MPPSGIFEQPRVVDRDCGGRRERRSQLDVASTEVALGSLGEIEVPEHLAADGDRDSEEGVHRRVLRGEADRPQVVTELVQPDRDRVLDQGTEDTLALRQVADLVDHRLVDADVDELLQAVAVGAQHTQRAVLGVEQLAGRLDDTAEHHLEGKVADDALVRLEQAAHTVLGGAHVMGTVDELRQQLIEFQGGLAAILRFERWAL